LLVQFLLLRKMQKGIYRRRELIVEWLGYATGVARENGQFAYHRWNQVSSAADAAFVMSMFFQSNET
jgi:hypothetical protein